MVEFINSFMSYGLLMLIIIALCGIGGFIAITLRKRKNDALESESIQEETGAKE